MDNEDDTVRQRSPKRQNHSTSVTGKQHARAEKQSNVINAPINRRGKLAVLPRRHVTPKQPKPHDTEGSSS